EFRRVLFRSRNVLNFDDRHGAKLQRRHRQAACSACILSVRRRQRQNAQNVREQRPLTKERQPCACLPSPSSPRASRRSATRSPPSAAPPPRAVPHLAALTGTG